MTKKRGSLFLAFVLSAAMPQICCAAGTESPIKVNTHDHNSAFSADTFVENNTSKNKYVIACVGDSITYGITKDANGTILSTANYPEALNQLLGEKYEVLNFGQPGATAINSYPLSYSCLEVYEKSLCSDADAVIFMLGTNDSSSLWDKKAFLDDYAELLDTYIEAFPDAAIFTMTPPCVYTIEGNDHVLNNISADVLDDTIAPYVMEISEEREIQVIDLHEYTRNHAEWFRDGVHPNDEGYEIVAAYIYENIVDHL